MNLLDDEKELRIKQRNDLLRRRESLQLKLGDHLYQTENKSDIKLLTFELANVYIKLYNLGNP